MSEALTRTKERTNYPNDALTILDAMSFDGRNTKLVGSISLRSQQYAGDYDAYEVVKTTSASLTSRFQHIIRTLQSLPNAYIGDIKAGVIDEWKVTHPSHLDELLAKKLITDEEKEEAIQHLKEGEDIKFHILRWTPKEILAGYKTLRDGRRYDLERAFRSPSIVKLDVVGLVANNRYTEFSILYEFHHKGEVLNKVEVDIEKSLAEDVEYYKKKNPFKAMNKDFIKAEPAILRKLDALQTKSDLLPSLRQLEEELGGLLNKSL